MSDEPQVEAAGSETPPSPPSPSTRTPAADRAAERLAALDDAPLEEHVEIYEDVHRQLQEGLAELDEGRP